MWKNAYGDAVYTQDVIFEIICRTVLEIFMGDSALFAVEPRLDNAEPIEAESFDHCAQKTVQMIKPMLPLYESEYGPKCRQLHKFMQKEMPDYWNA